MIDIVFNENKIGKAAYPGKSGAIFIGQNALYGWNAHWKENMGTAISGPFNPISGSVDIVIDRDVSDAKFFHADTDFTAGNFVSGREAPMAKGRYGKSTDRININGESIHSGHNDSFSAVEKNEQDLSRPNYSVKKTSPK